MSAFRKKRKSPYKRVEMTPPKQSYWNEYDHPEDSEDEGAYVLYIDPNEESLVTKTWRGLRSFLGGQKFASNEPLLGHDGTVEADMTEGTLTSSDEEEGLVSKRTIRPSYGSIGGTYYQGVQQATPRRSGGSDWVPLLTLACFAASILLMCVGYILEATGRRKLASEVDAGIVLSVASSLAFAVSGVGVTFGRRSPSWFAALSAVGVLAADAAAASMLLVWAFG